MELWTGSYGDTERSETSERDSIQVVSWNIEWALRITEAIAVLEAMIAAHPLDLILLQEMDESATDRIARALGMNYVFATAGVLHRIDRHFGNAVLSPWPLDAAEVTPLPHPTYVRRQARNVLAVTASIAGTEVRAYSTHAETPRVRRGHRLAQFDTIARVAGADRFEHAIVGGDFNTNDRRSISALTARLRSASLTRVSPDEPTFRRWGIDFTLDHIFARGLRVAETTVVDPAGGSDHRPVHARLALESDSNGSQ